MSSHTDKELLMELVKLSRENAIQATAQGLFLGFLAKELREANPELMEIIATHISNMAGISESTKNAALIIATGRL